MLESKCFLCLKKIAIYPNSWAAAQGEEVTRGDASWWKVSRSADWAVVRASFYSHILGLEDEEEEEEEGRWIMFAQFGYVCEPCLIDARTKD